MKIHNIGVLDIRQATEEILESCKSIVNIGFLLGTETTLKKLQPCELADIGLTLRVPDNVPLVLRDQAFAIDDAYLDSLTEPTMILVNGTCLIQTENLVSLENKVYDILVNGNTYCPSSIKGKLSTMGRFNGRMIAFEPGATFIDKTLNLTESLLFRLPKKTSTLKLRAMDPKLTASVESFESIEVLDSCWIERGLFQTWRDKLQVDFNTELQLLDAPIRYHHSDETMRIQELSKIQEATLAVDGTLTIQGEDPELNLTLTSICCKTLRAKEITIEQLKPLLAPGVSVETLESNKKKNHGKMILTATQLTTLDAPMSMKNHGVLIFDESVTPDLVKKGIAQIENYGAVKGPETLLTILAEKTVKNFGKIKPLDPNVAAKSETYTYENIGYLVL